MSPRLLAEVTRFVEALYGNEPVLCLRPSRIKRHFAHLELARYPPVKRVEVVLFPKR